MKEVLVTVFSDNKDSKVLEVLKNYKELLKDLNVCTQHYIYKKGLFIDIPKDSFKNIVFVEVSKDTDHNAKSNFTTLYDNYGKGVIVVGNSDNINTDTYNGIKLSLATRGFCTTEWGGNTIFLLSNEEDEILKMILKGRE